MKLMIDISKEPKVDMKNFKEFVQINNDGIIECMKKRRLPQTTNPFVSFINAKDCVRFMQYEEALQVMLDFTIEDEGQGVAIGKQHADTKRKV